MLGLSVWTPWKDIYTRLFKRIYTKLLATQDMEVKSKPKVGIIDILTPSFLNDFQVLVSQIWNAIIISMYGERLLSIEHVQKLLYHQIDSGREGKREV